MSQCEEDRRREAEQVRLAMVNVNQRKAQRKRERACWWTWPVGHCYHEDKTSYDYVERCCVCRREK